MNRFYKASMDAKKGFTLIELLVVIAIIGLLSSIVFASLGSARAKGRVAAAQGTMRSVITSLILCADGGEVPQVPTETINGDGTALCKQTSAGNSPASTVITASFESLPTGSDWIYCDGDHLTGCTTASVSSPPKLVATGDKQLIVCDESGCKTTPK